MRSIYTVMPAIENPGEYPEAEWTAQRTEYFNYWYHFDGEFLNEQASGMDKYPLKLNVYNMACMLHAGFLFGEVPDGNEPLVTTQVEPWGQNSTQEDLELAKVMSDLVTRVWTENNGRALQQENGIIAQVTGGAVFSTTFDPRMGDKGQIPIKIDLLSPEHFFPVWTPVRYWELMETFVAFEVSALQAKNYYNVKTDLATPALYQEHWTPQKYAITVDNKPVTWNEVPMSGIPLGGFVPYTYIPHIRAGEFYGISLLKDKQPLAEEVNARLADLGDIIEDNARQMAAISNVRNLAVRRAEHSVPVLDLGNTMPGMDTPSISYPAGVQANAATVQYASDLIDIARLEAYTPPVCYGLDEGSQRSALTLTFRMIPLIVHIRQERSLWTTGLDQVARQILIIAAEKELAKFTVADVRRMRIWQDWAPILPRDREQEVSEIAVRMNANLIPLETALERLGDIRDIKTAVNLIKAFMEYKAELDAPAPSSPFKGAGGRGEQSGQARPDTPQPSLSKEE